jgi:hypothetical protein
MTYQENSTGKLRRQTSKQAIVLAMEGRWQESIDINKSIIEHFPNDVDAHNRLGKAYMELADYTNAKEAYDRALALDQYNNIAKKNLQRLAHLANEKPAAGGVKSEKADPNLFIEEIGKAGIVNLYQIASPERLVKMMAGDKVILKPQGSSLVVDTVHGEYLGLVPSKQGQRLVKLMEGGNKYTAAVVSSNENIISVIIREIYQDPSQIDQVSFAGRRIEEIQPYTSDRVFRPEYEEEEEVSEAPALTEEGTEEAEETVEETEEEKEWEQES